MSSPVNGANVGIGERTGEMEQMLLEASETYDQRVDSKISALTSLLEPILLWSLVALLDSLLLPSSYPCSSHPSSNKQRVYEK